MGSAASVVVAITFMYIAKEAPACVVWTSLVFVPALTLLIGVLFYGLGLHLLGIVLITIGILFLVCLFSRWRRFIPFTIAIVKTVTGVIAENPMMYAVSCIGSVLSLIWSFIVCVAVYGFFIQFLGKGKQVPKQ